MPKKNRPNKVTPQKTTVLHGEVFAAFVREAQSIGNEVAARRAYQERVDAFLNERGLVEDFKAWCADR
jgi:hypothetical protein